MKKYIEMLIEMLKEAKEQHPTPIDDDILNKQEWIQYMKEEESEINNPHLTMEKIFGIDRMYFPPEDRLTDEIVVILYDAIIDLWKTYHFQPVFKVGTPIRKKYEKLLGEWKESHPLLKGSNATWYIELYHEPNDEYEDFEVE